MSSPAADLTSGSAQQHHITQLDVAPESRQPLKLVHKERGVHGAHKPGLFSEHLNAAAGEMKAARRRFER